MMSVKCTACQDGAWLPNGWKCDICGRVAHHSLHRFVRAHRPKIIVRWESPRNGCLREETMRTLKAARARRDELSRGHIVSEIMETYVP